MRKSSFVPIVTPDCARLNAAISLFNAGDADGAKEMFEAHDRLWGALDEDGKVDAGEDVDEQRRALRDALYGS